MDLDEEYATIVVPGGFTASLLAIDDGGASRTSKPVATGMTARGSIECPPPLRVARQLPTSGRLEI
jgi:hypothetical protein